MTPSLPSAEAIRLRMAVEPTKGQHWEANGYEGPARTPKSFRFDKGSIKTLFFWLIKPI